jgi:RNA binding exosome subunit
MSTSKTKAMGMYGNDIRSLKTVLKGKITEKVMKFKYLGNRISEFKKDINYNCEHVIE